MTPDELFQTAIAHHRNGQLAEAAAAYEQALQASSDPAPALLYFAGLAYAGLGRNRKAESLLGKAASSGQPRGDYKLAHANALAALGRHKTAIAVFQEAARLDPGNAALWFNLGNSCMVADRPGEAIKAFSQALELDPLMTQALANLANAFLAAQDYEGFAALLGRVYSLGMWRSFIADIALHGIGAVAKAETDDRDTIARPILKILSEMVATYPNDSALYWALGSLHLTLRDFDSAEADFEASVRLGPEQLGAIRALVLILCLRKENNRAAKLLASIKDEDPDATEMVKLGGYFITVAGMTAASIRVFGLMEQVYGLTDEIFENHFSWLLLSKDPDCHADARDLLQRRLVTHDTADNHVNLGVTYQKMKEDIEAVTQFRLALKMEPKNFYAWYNLAGTLLHVGDIPGSYEASKKAFRMRPDLIDSAINFSLAAGKLGLVQESENVLKRALRHNPDSPELLNLLGNLKMQRGNMKRALQYFGEARSVADQRNNPSLFQMQLMSVNYSMDVPPETTAEMHFRWGDAMVKSYADSGRRAPPPAVLKDKLRVGYMSGDYRNHSCAFFVGPLLEAHDAKRIEVFCYMTELGADDITNQFRRKAPHWREIKHLTDQAAADLIKQDGIDILVDLSGHTSGARLDLLAIKPAPIQVNWLGYPNTTGLSTIDYRITDALADPVGMTEHLHVETLYRLPHFLCYRPPEYTPEVGPLPVRRNGRITFGCFNNSNKITDQVVKTWSKIMHGVPDSHIFLKTSNLSDQLTLSAFQHKFEKNGIDPVRVECFPSFPSKYDHLMTYGEVDLALDPFPYNGTTTTFEALWMGVPMVALEGRVHAARVGHSILTGAGLGELVAKTISEYIDMAIGLAGDLPRLAAYRTTLRETLKASPLMDAKTFAAEMEKAYFDMWQHGVAGNSPRLVAATGRKRER